VTSVESGEDHSHLKEQGRHSTKLCDPKVKKMWVQDELRVEADISERSGRWNNKKWDSLW
jgi:hypothetical protein